MTNEALLLVGDSVTDQDLYYKTHFLAGDPFVYAQLDGRSLLAVGAMELSRAEKESSVSEVRTFEELGYHELLKEHGDRYRAYAQLLMKIVSAIGADAVRVSGEFRALHADLLRESGLQVRVVPDLLLSDRRHKSAEEINAIEEAQRATERSTARGIEILRESDEVGGALVYRGVPLTSERLRSEIEGSLTRDGMDVSHTAIVASGPGAADPHWQGEGPLRVDEPIVLDIFPRGRRGRYFADMTRTVVRGRPAPILQKMYDAVLASQESAFAMIRPGANGSEIHQAVVDVLREAGFDREDGGPRYNHGTGHGVGLDIHERPGIGKHGDVLEEGDVVTVEPGLYHPEIGGIRIEDMVVVTAGGCRNLTRFPKEFVV
ncbi:MAG: M24 family metallopeptidase [Chloroflexota bacterium]|nr:MAG: aminopeptidase P family protein [Chloroflexota bacterium]